jgi:hypothetical protein
MRVDELSPAPGSTKAKKRVGRGIGGKGDMRQIEPGVGTGDQLEKPQQMRGAPGAVGINPRHGRIVDEGAGQRRDQGGPIRQCGDPHVRGQMPAGVAHGRRLHR